MLFFYKVLTVVLYPFLIILTFLRTFVGKEDSNRFKEKLFFQKKEVISDKLIWFHTASIGEINSIIPVVRHFLAKNEDLKILITSVTLSSSKIFKDEFKNEKKIIHKYFPMDVSYLTKNFIKNWNPSLVVFVDSEIWPNFISEIKKKNIPIVLLNARITDKTCRRWLLLKNFAKEIFSSFSVCIASSLNSKKNLELLGANNIKYYGNLKYADNPKKIEKLEKSLINSLRDRKVWLAASTHKNEEKFCFQVHKNLKKEYRNILTIIAPRHINRIKEIETEANSSNLKYQIVRDNNEIIKNETEILLINSFGFLNSYYDYCKNVFIGKSLVKNLVLEGGQNPIEAARLGCKIYHGPYVYNFLEVYEFLKTNNISEEIKNPEELSSKIIHSINSQLKIEDSKVKTIEIFGKDILNKTIQGLEELV